MYVPIEAYIRITGGQLIRPGKIVAGGDGHLSRYAFNHNFDILASVIFVSS